MSGFAGDEVPELTPVTFAVAFTRAMRKQKTARYTPSLRTSLAIPKLLSARWLRLRSLVAGDYEEAAVLCTPLEDQDLARAVARSILFPDVSTDTASAKAAPEPVVAADPLADLAGDLADLDLDALTDLDDLDDLLSLEDEEADEPGAFELFENLFSSADPEERALGELIHTFGGPADLEAEGLRTLPLVKVWLARQLLGRVGELEPDWVRNGVLAGFGPDLARACERPWEVAGVLAGLGDPGLSAHLEDLSATGTCRDLGRTLAFLGPHGDAHRASFAALAMTRALDLSDFSELVVGLGEWIDPPADLCKASMAVSPRRTLEAAGWLEAQFGVDLRPDLFVAWLPTVPRPHLGLLAVVAVACPAWDEAVRDALQRELTSMQTSFDVDDVLKLIRALQETGLPVGREASEKLSTALLVKQSAETFLPVLDVLVSLEAPPDDLEAVLNRAREVGVPEEEVLDRLGAALEQLRLMIMEDVYDVDRYQRLIDRIQGMPTEMMGQLAAQASAAGNFEALAALLAVDMGGAAAVLDPELAQEALGYRGIGGGPNLLVQWFKHRKGLQGSLRAHVKVSAMAALMDAAFHWIGAGGGSGEKGLIPQSRSRPFRAGDSLDALDIEETLSAIVSAGVALDQVREEHLLAADTSAGKAALVVLIDISGSMGADQLAACAIAVVMLLGRLLPEEVALAVFESNTHVVKELADASDLDAVADKVLELEATGGTRVDAALRWATEQFEGAPEADTRVLFLLSDFAFFEGEQALRANGEKLSEAGVRLLAATHGYVDKRVLAQMMDTIGGEQLSMKDLRMLPALLIEALANLTS